MTAIIGAFIAGVIVGLIFAAAWDVYFMRRVKRRGR